MNLKVSNVSKTYPNSVQALKNVTLTIPNGMCGLLGPSGVGKSTLMRMIATLQEPDEGSIHLGDPSSGSGQAIDVLSQKDEVRKTLGYLPQEFGVYPKVNAEDLLDHFAVLKGIAERRARKVVVDRAGVETEMPMDEWVEIGVFAPAEGGEEELSPPLYVEKHRIRSGEQTITVTVPRRPVLAGIDPYHLLDREEKGDDDNIAGVKVENL